MYNPYQIPDFTWSEKINKMKEFTETYCRFEKAHPAIREAMCLKVQFPAVMGRMRDDDLFAGELGALPIGLNPQAECFQLGYILDEEELKTYFQQNITEEQRMTLVELRGFWKQRHTTCKIRKSYDEELREALPDKDYVYDRAPAYALYRISGTQLDFALLLKNGASGIRRRIREKAERAGKNARELYRAMEIALDVYADTCAYYRRLVKELLQHTKEEKRREHLTELCGALKQIASEPAQSFLEAIQMTLLYWWISGSFNFGRMDDYLAEYYTRDVDTGRISEERALELLVGMWRSMSLRHKPYDTRVTIGGEDRGNPKAGDRFSLLAIQATIKTMDVTPQLTLRFSKNTPEEVLKKAYEAIGQGATFPMLYCDEVNIPSVQAAFGVPYEDAVQYCPYGCGEYILYRRSIGTPSGLINLLKVLELTLNNGRDLHTGEPQAPDLGNLCDYPSFESLWNAYTQQVEYFTHNLARQEEAEYVEAGKDCAFLFFSLLTDDCIDRGRALLDGGVRYLGGTLESYGNINTADSLTAIRRLVYEEKRIRPDQLMKALEANFEGYEEISRMLLEVPKFGNDESSADEMAARVHEQVCLAAKGAVAGTKLDSYLVVVINNNANTVLGKHTAASADGRQAHTFMANANNPYHGADKKGITAMLNSLLNLDTHIHAGCVQNLKLSRQMFTEKLEVTRSVLAAYFENGGAQAMISVVGREDLENAVREPEKYKNLLVRVGGFSARFVELNSQEQQEMIARTLY